LSCILSAPVRLLGPLYPRTAQANAVRAMRSTSEREVFTASRSPISLIED